MIGLEHPLRLAWLVPWLVLVLILLRLQLRALVWLEANIAPRFLTQLSRSRPSTIKVHMLFLLLCVSITILHCLSSSQSLCRLGHSQDVSMSLL